MLVNKKNWYPLTSIVWKKYENGNQWEQKKIQNWTFLKYVQHKKKMHTGLKQHEGK